jgi:hypothetical protein
MSTRNISWGYRYHFTYRVGLSTETALFHVVHRLEKSVKHKEVVLSAFLDIEGAFDNTSFVSVFIYSKIFKVIIDRDYWRNVDLVVPEDSLIWFTDGSRIPS